MKIKQKLIFKYSFILLFVLISGLGRGYGLMKIDFSFFSFPVPPLASSQSLFLSKKTSSHQLLKFSVFQMALNTKDQLLPEPMHQQMVPIDTVWILPDGRKIYLRATNNMPIHEQVNEYGLLDSLICSYSNSFQAALAYEQSIRHRYGKLFKRDSSGFYIRLQNGQWKKLLLDETWEETGHSFVSFSPKTGFYSIRTQWGEGNGYKLVSQNTGEVTRIIGRPYFSPDRRYILAVSCDLDAGYSANGFQLLENQNGHLITLVLYESENRCVERVYWTNSHTALLRFKESPDDKHPLGQIFYAVLEIQEP